MSTIFFLALLLGAPGEGAPGRDLYYRALGDLRAGRADGALAGLRRILAEHPQDPFADDALLEIARMAEEVQGDPAGAIESYRELTTRYPSSRLVRRARARLRFLEAHMGSGGEVLRDYMAIQRSSKSLPADAVARMERLIERHPSFSLAPEGAYWMGAVLARDGQTERARQKLLRLVDEHPRHEAAGKAWALLGQMALDAGDFAEAEAAFLSMGKHPGAGWARSSKEALGRLERARWKRRIRWSSVGLWVLSMVWLWGLLLGRIRTGRVPARTLRRPPVEALVYFVLMAVLTVWAWTGTRQTRDALLLMTFMVLPLLLPNGWLLRAWAPRGARAVLWAAGLLVVCAACVVGAVGLAGMEDQVLHTLEHGPE